MQRVTLWLSWLTGVCQLSVIVADVISIETPSKEHMDHHLIQKMLVQEVDSEECRFDNLTWERVIAERKQEMRWEARIEAYKAGLITTGLYVDEKDLATHWTDRYSGFWFPHNFRRKRRNAVDTAMADLADNYRELEVMRNIDEMRRRREAPGPEEPMNDDRLGPQDARLGAKLNRRKRSLAKASSGLRPQSSAVARLRRSLDRLRNRRELKEEYKAHMDEYANQAKDYNYYDYNNMLTAVTLASSTIKYVEKHIAQDEDLANANDIHQFNRKLKNVFGGFHNDSELLTFLRNYHYKNFTHEERKFAFWDDYMKKRADDRVEFFQKNLANYKKWYRSFREKSNKENHYYVNPDTEDQSAVIPHFNVHEVLNYTELYKYFRKACEYQDPTPSSEMEPEPENHYAPANWTSSSEGISLPRRSGEKEAFISDYDNERFNTSGWTKSRKRKRAVGPRVYGRINIQVYDNSYTRRMDDKKEKEAEKPEEKVVIDEFVKVDKDRVPESKKGKLDSANQGMSPETLDAKFEMKDDKRNGEKVKNINIRFQIDQEYGVDTDKTNEKNMIGQQLDVNAGGKFNVLSNVLDLLKKNVNMKFINNVLSNLQVRDNQKNGAFDDVFNFVRSIVNGDPSEERKPFKVFEMYEIKLSDPKDTMQTRMKRSVGEKQYLTASHIVKTVDSNNDYILHMYLTPTVEFPQNKQKTLYRSKRNAPKKAEDYDANKEQEEEVKDENECPIMQKVFYWKKVGEMNANVQMSHEKTIEAISMDTWHKRRDRRIQGITTKEELLEQIRNEKEAKEKEEEDRIAAERRDAEAAKNPQPEEEETEDPNDCPLMKRVFYWKKVAECNKDLVGSHDAEVDAVTMDDWHKRRDRHILGQTLAGEELLQPYEDFIRGPQKHIDPKKGETLDRKKRENADENPKSAENQDQGCPLTFEPPGSPKEESAEKPEQGCPLTFEPPESPKEESAEKPEQGCPLTFEPPVSPKEESAEKPEQGCPLTFEPPEPLNKEAEVPPQGCPLTFKPNEPKAQPTIIPNPVYPKDERVTRILGAAALGYRSHYSPYVLNKHNVQRSRLPESPIPNPVSGLSEPRFTRVVFHGKNWVRHVHYVSAKEREQQPFLRSFYQVENLYRENFLVSSNETLIARVKAMTKVPRRIQHHYRLDHNGSVSAMNMYYDVEGDFIYPTLHRRRIPIHIKRNTNLPNKLAHRSYFPRVGEKWNNEFMEPFMVQLHYNY